MLQLIQGERHFYSVGGGGGAPTDETTQKIASDGGDIFFFQTMKLINGIRGSTRGESVAFGQVLLQCGIFTTKINFFYEHFQICNKKKPLKDLSDISLQT